MVKKSSGGLLSFMFLSFSILLVGGIKTSLAYTIMGNVSSYAEDGYYITFHCANGKVRLGLLKDNIIRVQMTEIGKDFPGDTLHMSHNGPWGVITYDWSSTAVMDYELSDYGSYWKVLAGEIVVKVGKSPFRLSFYDGSDRLLTEEKIGSGLGYDGARVYEKMVLPADEHFFGGGAITADNYGPRFPVDKRGSVIVCDCDENYGFPTPWFMSSRGYGIYFNNIGAASEWVRLELGIVPGEYTFRGPNRDRCDWDMDYYFIYGPNFNRLLEDYVHITGKPYLPEKWFFGIIQSKNSYYTAQQVMDVASRFRNGNYPADVIVCDYPWRGQNNNLDWSSAFSDNAQMISHLDSLNFKCILHENAQSTLYPEPAVGYNWSHMIDVTDPAASGWYWGLHRPRMDDGVDGWWQDNSERASGAGNASGYEVHNLGGMLWAKILVEGCEREYGRHVPVVSRAGPCSSHRYIALWVGDTPSGTENLYMDLDYIRDGGLTAYTLAGADMGGYHGSGYPGDEVMHRRVIQMLLVFPVARVHGVGNKEPWQGSLAVQDMYRYYAKLRYRLIPYIYSAAIEGHQTGRPILASLVLDYQTDVNTYDKDYDFLFGRNILVAPVIGNANSRKVYLPAGKWMHYWTGLQYAGGQSVTVSAPLSGRDGLPMFIKAGAVIPMMPEMNYIYEKEPDLITLDVYPDEREPSNHVIYDCETVASPITETTFTCEVTDGNNIEITISDSNVAYELWVHCNKVSSSSVVVDSRQLIKFDDKAAYEVANEGWYYGAGCFYGSESIETLNIKMPKSYTSHVIQLSGFAPLPVSPVAPQPPIDLKVDLGDNGQQVKEGWIGWTEGHDVGERVSRSNVGGTNIDVAIEKTSGPELGFRNLYSIPHGKLTGDLVHINDGDGGIRMILSDLEPGDYIITTYHNVIWPSGDWDEIDITVDGILKVDNLRMSQAASDDESAASATYSFTVAGSTATITFSPQGIGTWRNVALNGFELVSACSRCADFNHDGVIDGFDFQIFVQNWLCAGQAGGYNWADVNCDGTVNFKDFAVFASQWLETCE